MSQSTALRIRDQISFLRSQPQLPFSDLLDAGMVQEVLKEENVRYRERIFTPLVTVWTFLTQVINLDHCCVKAVGCLIACRTARGQKPCSAETSSYCKARQRLPLGVVTRLVRRTAADLEKRAPEAWLWKGREVLLADGTTASMPDTPKNQKAFPQARTQSRGLGFPIARVVADKDLPHRQPLRVPRYAMGFADRHALVWSREYPDRSRNLIVLHRPALAEPS
jgi:hypothetical protein